MSLAPINDPNSTLVKDALTRRCIVCKADRDAACVSIIDGGPVPGRIVHYARTTA